MSLLDTVEETVNKVFATLTDSGGRHLTPIARLTINGQPFGSATTARIVSIDLTDKRGFEADDLTIELDDYDGAIAIPSPGSKITLHLGYQETGIVDKGEYLFSEFTHTGAPDRLSITARAADLAETLAQQKERSWHKKTLYQIVETIAKEHGYQYRIAEQYRRETIAHIDQTNESDASFLSRLAERYDAIATVKAGRLLFIPAGEAQTAGGAPIPPLTITRASGDNHSFNYSATNAYNAVRAYYTDKRTDRRKEVVINKDNLEPQRKTETRKTRRRRRNGSRTITRTVQTTRRINTDGLKIKTLRHLYASEQTALTGARAAFRRLLRGAAQFSLTLAVGRPDLTPETPVSVSGFKPEIDSQQWLIKEISHRIDSSGYSCNIQLEGQINLDEPTNSGEKPTPSKKAT